MAIINPIQFTVDKEMQVIDKIFKLLQEEFIQDQGCEISISEACRVIRSTLTAMEARCYNIPLEVIEFDLKNLYKPHR